MQVSSYTNALARQNCKGQWACLSLEEKICPEVLDVWEQKDTLIVTQQKARWYNAT